MKIISKFKDYYDYLVGIYGEDPLLVFDRRENNPQFADLPRSQVRELPPPTFLEGCDLPFLSESMLYVGNQRVHLFNTGTKVYTSFDVLEIQKEFHVIERRRYCFAKTQFSDGHQHYINSDMYIDDWEKHIPVQAIDRKVCFPNYAAVPLLWHFETWQKRIKYETFVINPQLSTLGVYLPEQWLWQEISAYLGQLRSEQESSPPVPDKNKIKNKGFDVKHSFRPKMKHK